jgi:transposase
MLELRKCLLGLSPEAEGIHITMEASGSYYVQLAHYLHANSFAVSVVNAMRVRRFGELYCQLDKTDDLDALTLARFGASLRPQPWAPPPPIYEEIFQRIVQRGALVRIHAQTANRRHALNYRIAHIQSVRTRQEELHKLLRRQIKGIDRELARVIAQDADWQVTAERITSIPGVGLVTAAWLMMLTNNFTTCDSPKELAAFIGLIPRRRQSGESLNTYRSVGHVGHDDIRQHLFVVTMSCLRYKAQT